MVQTSKNDEAFYELAVFLFELYKLRKQSETVEAESAVDNLCFPAITT